MARVIAQGQPETPRLPNVSPFRRRVVWPLGLYAVLLFCQLWIDVSGFTVRAEDVLAFVLLSILLFPILATGKLRYSQNPLNRPLLVWCTVLLLSVGTTMFSPYSGLVKKDAAVNGIRLVLAVGTFYVVERHPAPAGRKLQGVVGTVLGFSLVTTAVSLLQMGHWDGWLPISLPSMLTTFREGANTQPGRELFALYLGDTGSHTWSGSLAMQALLVWVLTSYTRRPGRKLFIWAYFTLLMYILVRVSVRNSILGLFASIATLVVLRASTKHWFNKMLRIVSLICLTVVLFYGLLYVIPDTYFVQRIRQVVPRVETGKVIIDRGSNVYGRFDYWVAALRMFAGSPIFGRGYYSYRALSEQFLTRPIVHAHNAYLQTLAETGLIGAAVLGWVSLSLVRYLRRVRRSCGLRSSAKLLWELTVGSFVFLAFTSMFGNTLWSPNHVAFRMIILGILVDTVRDRTR